MIFNDKTHGEFAADKATRAERTVTLRHGEKMLFGADKQKGIVFENMKLKVVTVGEDGYTLDDVLTHDAHQRDTTLHSMLAAMKYPDYPVALGVIRAVEDATVYDPARSPGRSRRSKPRAKSTRWTSCCIRARLGRSSNGRVRGRKTEPRKIAGRKPARTEDRTTCGTQQKVRPKALPRRTERHPAGC